MEIKILVTSAWARFKAVAQKVNGISSNSDVEMGQGSSENGWRKAPNLRGASCEAILHAYASMAPEAAITHLNTSRDGLTDMEAISRLQQKGLNLLSTKKPPKWWQLLLSVIPTPFNVLLALIAVISVSTPPSQWSTFIILVIMIVISCGVQFWQEYRSAVAAIKLQAGVSTDVRVRRRISNGLQNEDLVVDEKSLVPGDILLVDPGDSVPADCMVLQASNLYISQSSLTGESEPLRKSSTPPEIKTQDDLFELENIIFMGTSVISGSGVALVLNTGDDAFIATIMKQLNKRRPLNSFQRGVRSVTYMMIIFMFVMVPIVLGISGKVTGNWSQAALFSVSVAVGLVPEMLPAIVNANLARGAFALSRKKAIVKRLDSIQNIGGMTVLCSDKTGTLTEDKISLYHHVNASGNEDSMVFQLAYINAFHQSGKKNSIDSAILERNKINEKDASLGQKIAEIPFSFETRRSSSIIKTPDGRLVLICKGAFEEVLSLCTRIRFGSDVLALDGEHRKELTLKVANFNNGGYRVIAVATCDVQDYELDEEQQFEGLDTRMTMEGLLTFLDPPKDDAKDAIQRLQFLGVDVRVLTGDNLGVALEICRKLNLVQEANEGEVQAITGSELARIKDVETLDRVIKHCKVFAKLSPSQKGQVVMSLKKQGEVVGMLGDGINDCVALRYADAGISVDSGMNVAKDCADIILTQKELSIIVDCVVTGRITQGNSIKYIKMVASSSFGNAFSILIASCWLPYSPMSALQILIQNLFYDISQIAIPWDRMDAEYIATPQQWNAKDLLRFVLVLGPTSSTIDMCTFCLGWFYYGVRDASDQYGVQIFHTHWFLEGLLTQTLIVHLLRTAKVPVFQSRAAKALVFSTVGIMVVGFLTPFIPPFAIAMDFVQPKSSFIGFLALELLVYCVEVQLVKMLYVRLWGKWL